MKGNSNLKADAFFEGGMMTGMGLVGAISVAEEIGYQWVNVAGTSAGAIVAALLAAGYNAAELKTIIGEVDFKRFKDTGLPWRIPLFGSLFSFEFRQGVYEGKFLEDWLRGLLEAKNVRTFRDLVIAEYRDDWRYRFKLRVVASDISRGQMLVLPQDIEYFGIKAEDLDIAAAVRMSVSIPLFFTPVKLRSTSSGLESYIVDGNVLSKFPVWLFDTEGGVPEWPTFGFKMVTESAEGARAPHRIMSTTSFLVALVAALMEAHEARHIEDDQFVRTIATPTLGVGATDFDLSREQTEALYQSGRQAAERFFAIWDFDAYIDAYRKPRSIDRLVAEYKRRFGVDL